MEVADGLTAPPPDVRDEPVTTLRDALATGDLRGRPEQPAEQWTVSLGEVGGRSDVRPWDDQDVRRSPRGDIAEGHDEIVGMHLRRRDLACRDLAEQAVGRRRNVRRRRRSRRVRPWRARVAHHSTGLALMSQPIAPTRPAIA